MCVAIGSLLHEYRLGVARVLDSVDGHVQAGLLGAGHVERHVAVGFVALDARSDAPLLANVTRELPAGCRYCLNGI